MRRALPIEAPRQALPDAPARRHLADKHYGERIGVEAGPDLSFVDQISVLKLTEQQGRERARFCTAFRPAEDHEFLPQSHLTFTQLRVRSLR